MTDPLLPPQPDDLQFEKVEVSQPNTGEVSTLACAFCHGPITRNYFALRDKLLCPQCYVQVREASAGRGFEGFVKASLFGLGAGAVGAAIWAIIRAVTNHELGIVAVVVGYMVGKAVRKGSGGWGGLGYQFLAIAITYLSIAGTFATIFFADAPVAAVPLAFRFVCCLAAPVLVGFQSPIMLIIYGIALWEAWKFTSRRPLPITGPFQIGPPPGLETISVTTLSPPAANSGGGGV